MTSFLEKAESWILNSGIYILDRNDPNYGAIYSYYDHKVKNYELVYAEATGYVISLLKYLYSLNKDSKLIDFARASGDWLIKLAEKYNGIIVMGIKDGSDVRQAYAFDNGICCKGFLDLYDLTGDRKYLEYAEKIADWLVNKALNEDGSVKPLLDIDTGNFVQDEKVWYKASGSFHSKISMSLLQLYSINKDDKLLDAATKVCEWAIGQQKPDGSFPANKHIRSVNLHAHSYTVEALLYAYASQNTRKFLDAAEKAVDWMLKVQEQDGSLWLWYGDGFAKMKASYAIAQTIRILLLMQMLNSRKNLIEAAERASKFLSTMQGSEKDQRIEGSFYEDVRRYGFMMRKSSHVTSWATMFAIQALSMLMRTDKTKPEVEIKGLF